MKTYYYLKGEYGQQYGPMSLDELRSRLDAAQTLVKQIADGSDWQPASSWPELQDLFPPTEEAAPKAQTPRTTPPPIPYTPQLKRSYDEASPLDSQGRVRIKYYKLMLSGNIATLAANAILQFLGYENSGGLLMLSFIGLIITLGCNQNLRNEQILLAEKHLKWARALLYISILGTASYIALIIFVIGLSHETIECIEIVNGFFQ